MCSHSSGNQKSEVRVLAGPAFCGAPREKPHHASLLPSAGCHRAWRSLAGRRYPGLYLCPHRDLSLVGFSVFSFLSLLRTLTFGVRGPPNSGCSHLGIFNYICTEPYSKEGHIRKFLVDLSFRRMPRPHDRSCEDYKIRVNTRKHVRYC